MKGKNKKYPTEKAKKIGSTLKRTKTKTSITDVEGSYTGTATDGSKPDQDADDL